MVVCLFPDTKKYDVHGFFIFLLRKKASPICPIVITRTAMAAIDPAIAHGPSFIIARPAHPTAATDRANANWEIIPSRRVIGYADGGRLRRSGLCAIIPPITANYLSPRPAPRQKRSDSDLRVRNPPTQELDA